MLRVQSLMAMDGVQGTWNYTKCIYNFPYNMDFMYNMLQYFIFLLCEEKNKNAYRGRKRIKL